MPTVTYEYVYFQFGRHRRRPRASNGGFVEIPGLPPNVLSNVLPPSSVQASPAMLPPTWPPGNKPAYAFSFVNVSGGDESKGGGGGTSFDPSKPPPPAAVGTEPIVVLAVYLPISGNGPPPTDFGATIDAFDKSTNQLVSDDFVTATPDGGQTSSGNVWGWVDTTSNTEKIAAYAHITPTNADFDKWVNLQSPQSTQGIAGADLTVKQSTDFTALAFYMTPPPPDPCATILQRLYTLLNAKRLPVSEVPGWKQELLSCYQRGKITKADYDKAIAALGP
jgi:hypothetical protein